VIKKKALTGVGVKAGTKGKLQAQNDAVRALLDGKNITSRGSFGSSTMRDGMTP